MLRMILNENALDYNLLSSLSKGLIDELKSDIKLKNAQAELENIQLIFSTIGVDIKFEGMLPENNENSRLIIDVIREACTNAARHGFATEIKIQSEQIDNFFNLNVGNKWVYKTYDSPTFYPNQSLTKNAGNLLQKWIGKS